MFHVLNSKQLFLVPKDRKVGSYQHPDVLKVPDKVTGKSFGSFRLKKKKVFNIRIANCVIYTVLGKHYKKDFLLKNQNFI